MRFAVSNIAWPPEDRLKAYDTLIESGFEGLEIAPGLFFFDAEDPFMPGVKEHQRAVAELSDSGLTLVSMQSLLFGTEGAALFEGEEALQRFEMGMFRAIHLAGRLEIPNLVFGAPKQRVVPDRTSSERAIEIAVEVFRRIGDIALAEGTRVSIEANPVVYGTNFLTHASQALDFVRRTAHPAISLILDVGAMHINEEFNQIPRLITEAEDVLSHVHISEPQLKPAPKDPAQAAHVLEALVSIEYIGAVSIEMLPTADPIPAMAESVKRLHEARQLVSKNGFRS